MFEAFQGSLLQILFDLSLNTLSQLTYLLNAKTRK